MLQSIYAWCGCLIFSLYIVVRSIRHAQPHVTGFWKLFSWIFPLCTEARMSLSCPQYDTQLIVGGAHKKHQFGVDDYVFAALNIYLDIINLFLLLLQLLQDRR